MKLTEADTRAHFIDPLIRALGYQEIGDVQHELFLTPAKQFLDYLLFLDGKARIAVEAKALDVAVGDANGGAQVVQYAVVWLVNTGWTGGPYGVGERMNIAHTRSMVRAALDGTLALSPDRRGSDLRGRDPVSCPDVPDEFLQPRSTWADGDAYDRQARALAEMFAENFEAYASGVPSASERPALGSHGRSARAPAQRPTTRGSRRSRLTLTHSFQSSASMR